MDNTAFLQALRRFVHAEADEQTRKIHAMWKESVEMRVLEGECIAGLNPSEVQPHIGTFRIQHNQSKFRPGDELLLNLGNPFDKPSIQCTLDTESEDQIRLRPGFGCTFVGLDRSKTWVLDRAVVDVRELQLGVLGTLAEMSQTLAAYRALVEGAVPPDLDPQRMGWALQQAKALKMNPSQAEGFAAAYATRNFYLIQGPPGTGKTWVLAHLAATLASQGQRVLITAFTHRAINNALRKTAEKTGFQRIAKIGQSDQADDLGSVTNCEYLTQWGIDLSSHLIIGGTCFALRSKRLRDMHFDTVIFDEAGQMTLPLAFAGMLAADRYIFVGDHQQMPPVIAAKHDESWVTQSIFERIYPRVRSTMLDTTYRMNAEINAFPSRAFYGGRLVTAPGNAHERLRLTRRSRSIVGDVLNPDKPEVLALIPHANRGMRSPEEAILAAHLIREALEGGVPPTEIAVITPYRAQMREIRRRLREVCPNTVDLDALVIDTVERIQGQERDMVIVSLTTSDPGHAAKRAEFYFKPNRLNVAITRPRLKRIILASPQLFRTEPEDETLRAWVEIFRAFARESCMIKVFPEAITELVERQPKRGPIVNS